MQRKKSQNSESEINHEEEKMDNKTEEEKMDNNTNIACNDNEIPRHSNKKSWYKNFNILGIIGIVLFTILFVTIIVCTEKKNKKDKDSDKDNDFVGPEENNENEKKGNVNDN